MRALARSGRLHALGAGLLLRLPGPCLDAHEKLEFFHSFFITSIFRPMYEVVNVGKNNN
jgi:hypothetical protein